MSQTVKSSYFARGVVGILFGASIFVGGLIMEPILSLSDFSVVEGQFDAGYAYAALALVIVGLCVLFASMTKFLTDESMGQSNEDIGSVFAVLRKALSQERYSRLLVLSILVYAIFYMFASGTIVYNPKVNFSVVYHTSIPSSSVATCCAPLGQTPLAVFYLTDHFGLLFVPANLFLLFALSWLVGINAALLTFAFSVRGRKRSMGWVGGIGAAAGLFTSCPTCASLAILALLGGAGTLSTALLLGPLQLSFIGISIPALGASAILLARSLRGEFASACVVP